MVEVKDIVDQESFEAWMNDRPQYEIDAVVGRAALRVLPIFLYWVFVENEESLNLTIPIRTLRQGLFSYAFSFGSFPKVGIPVPDLVSALDAKVKGSLKTQNFTEADLNKVTALTAGNSISALGHFFMIFMAHKLL